MASKTNTILVVEDERALLEAIRLKLEKHGFDVVSARSVEQALSYLTDDVHVDAIWLDHYLMGKETGLDFVVSLKEHKTWKTIPVFVVSNTATADKKQAYLQLGVNEYFVKSNARLDVIIEEIQTFLHSQ